MERAICYNRVENIVRLLLLSFYFPPDLSAGSFRCAALVEALRQEHPDIEIDLLTTQPNRYKQNAAPAEALEVSGNVRVQRLTLPSHNSAMRDQAKAFMSYARQVWKAARTGGPYDAIFATSSRLMTASLAAACARRLRLPLYLDIRDLFADTIKDVLPGRAARSMGPAIRWLERWTFRSADRINIVSAGFAEDISRIAPQAAISTFTNGIDDEFLTPFAPSERSAEDVPLIVYAGNIGEGQGLHRIVPEVARQLQGKARFRIIGHGGRFDALQEALADGCHNVECLPPVPRAALHDHYRQADILFLHLNDYPAFRKVLPSKIFEYAATGRPIVAGVAGYSAAFIADRIDGAKVFAPCDVPGMVDAIEQLNHTGRTIDRSEFVQRFARHGIAREMATEVATFVRGRH